MTTINIDRAVLEQALEYYEKAGKFLDVCRPAIRALRDALAQPESRREWQGLTDAEFDWICDGYATVQGAGRAIDAALKEKNHE